MNIENSRSRTESRSIGTECRDRGNRPAGIENSTDARPLVERLLLAAVQRRASDLHVEPVAGGYQVKFRIDGLLEPADTLASESGQAVVNRLMVLAHLLTYRQNVPQEGRLSTAVADHGPLEMRLSVIPTRHGLRAVVRLPAELLRHGQTLAESLGLAAREMPRRDLAAISAAERSGRLLTTLERMKSERALWHPSDELTWPYVGYALFAAATLCALLLLWAVLILPEWIKLLRSYGVALPFGFLFPSAPPSDIFLQPTALNKWTLPATMTATVVSVPPILIFLRKTLTPCAHRWRWTGWLWDRALWCFPVARSLERSRSWAGRLDVTLLPHLENCHTRYSIAVVLASLASRR